MFTSDDGFATADALAGPSDLVEHVGNFADAGPADHGALFDFDFGTLAAGATKTFKTYYGAAGTEVAAVDALNKVGAEAYSLGEPSTPDGPTLGTPEHVPVRLRLRRRRGDLRPERGRRRAHHQRRHGRAASTCSPTTPIPNGDALTVTGKTNGAHGTVSCTSAGVCTYTPTGRYTGPDSFTYTVERRARRHGRRDGERDGQPGRGQRRPGARSPTR